MYAHIDTEIRRCRTRAGVEGEAAPPNITSNNDNYHSNSNNNYSNSNNNRNSNNSNNSNTSNTSNLVHNNIRHNFTYYTY